MHGLKHLNILKHKMNVTISLFSCFAFVRLLMVGTYIWQTSIHGTFYPQPA